MPVAPFTIAVESPRSPDIEAILDASLRFTMSLYPPESWSLISIDELDSAGVRVHVAREPDGCALGIVAVVERAHDWVEIKRLFVTEAARGRGVAARLLDAAEADVRSASIPLVRLETGPKQQAAIRLYERAGYTEIPAFGSYAGDPNSVCFEKHLTGDAEIRS